MKPSQLVDIVGEYFPLLVGRRIPEGVQPTVIRHYQMLLEWSKTVNLIGAVDDTVTAESLYLDSLVSASFLARAFKERSIIHDVGSGAGFPGLFLPLFFASDTSFVLYETRRRKASFLKTAVRELGFSNLQVENARVRPNSFIADATLSRATFPPVEWLSLAATLLKPSGRAALFLAGDRGFDAVVPTHAGEMTRIEIFDYTLPLTGRRRSIQIYELRG